MTIDLPFDSSKESIDLIKFSALYYDKVNVICPFYTEGNTYQLYSSKILDDIADLTKHGIAKIDFLDVNDIYNNTDVEYDDFVFDLVKDKMGWDSNHIEDVTFSNEQIINGYNNIVRDWPILREFVDNDYTNDPRKKELAGACVYLLCQLYTIYASICNNQSIIISNDLISNCVKSICEKYSLKINKSICELIAENAIPIFLPNFYQMRFDEIIELRYLAKDELEEMRHYINSLSLEYSPDDTQLVNAKILLEKKIRPSIKQLESKVYGLRVGMIQKAIQTMKNPLTYTPMLTTFFSDIPSHIALAMSMGLIATDAGLEYLKQKKELETDPLFFSVELKNKVKNYFDL